jgi:Ca2+-binding EF-hand superfamily protein
MNRDKTMRTMNNSRSLTIAVLASCLIAMSVPALAAEKKSRKPQGVMLIGIVEEAHNDHLMIATTMHKREKRKLILNEQSDVKYVGYDERTNEIETGSMFRAQVSGEAITSMYVTPAIGKSFVEPTPEMLKMTQSELFQLADKNQNRRISYVEMSQAIKPHSPKHGPVMFYKADTDRSGALNRKQFDELLVKVTWWKMSRKTPEEWFNDSDQDNNGVLSQKELAILQGTDAHIDKIFKSVDKDKSGDLAPAEVFAFINARIYPSLKNKE